MNLKEIKNNFCSKCEFAEVAKCECIFLRRFVETGIESNYYNLEDLQLTEYMQAYFPLTIREELYNSVDMYVLNHVISQRNYLQKRKRQKQLEKECVV